MNVIQKVFSDSLFTAFRSIASITRAIVVIPLITKLIGIESYGIWVTVLAIVGLFSSVGGMHLHGSLIRYTPEESKQNQTYTDVLFLTIIVGMLILILMIVGVHLIDIPNLLSGSGEIGNNLFILVAFLIFLTLIFKININFPRAKGNVKTYDSLILLKNMIETLVLTGVFLAGKGICEGLLSLVISLGLLNILILFLVILNFDIPYPNHSNFWKYFSYSAPMIPKEISGKLLLYSDKFLLIFFLGPASVGIYSVAESISKPLVNLTNIFNPTLYPTIANEWDKKNFTNISKIYKNIFRYYSILGIPGTAGIIILSEHLMTIISTSETAQQGVYLVPIIIIGYFLKGYDNSVRYILTSAKRTDIIGGSVAISVIINIFLNLVLIPRYEILGAAFATFISHMTLFSILMYYSHSVITLLIPWKTITRSIIATVIMSFVVVTFTPDLSHYTILITVPIIGCIVYFTILLVLGEFSISEISSVRSLVKDLID